MHDYGYGYGYGCTNMMTHIYANDYNGMLTIYNEK